MSQNPHGADQRILKSIHSNTVITRLNLASCGLQSNGAVVLASALRTNIHLTELNIAGNSIGDEGVAAFERILADTEDVGTIFMRSPVYSLWIPRVEPCGSVRLIVLVFARN